MEYDIMFRGVNDEGWLVEGNSARLINNNDVFKSLISRMTYLDERGRKVVDISEPVDGRSYNYLVRHIQGEEISFSHYETAICNLHLSNSYLCVTLAEKAVDYLLTVLDEKTVLAIFQGIYHFCNPSLLEVTNDFTPSAPSVEETVPSTCAPGIEKVVSPLKNSCLQLICDTGTGVMIGEYFEDLNGRVLKTILSLRNLRVVDEVKLFTCLLTWARCECMRQKIPADPCNLRLVLGDMLFSVRYLTMTKQEFVDGPGSFNLLSPQEKTTIQQYLSGQDVTYELPSSLQPHFLKLKSPRCCSNKKEKKIGKKILSAIGYGVCALADVVVG